MSVRALVGAGLVAAILVGTARPQEVSETPHNLSVRGPGAIRAASEEEVCIFCHTPHNANPVAPLWNRRDPGRTYTTYTSSTLKAEPGQPSGTTRLCLSCHDGTIALGSVVSRRAEIVMAGSARLPPGRSQLGLDLSDDHPVSVDYAAALAESRGVLRPSPALHGRSLLDGAGLLQCTACHDPHDNRNGDFLRVDPRRGALCKSCHDEPGWEQSAHAGSTRTWADPPATASPRMDMQTVGEHACGACHSVHQAPGRVRLLHSDREEEVCYACHSGDVAQHDIRAEMAKWRSHDPSRSRGLRDPARAPDGRAGHVECEDCHDPHGVGGEGELPPALWGVSGLSAAGTPLETARYLYEVCFKCHASETNSDPYRIPRVADQASVSRRLDSGNPSFHPVVAPGRNPDVPSLKPPHTPQSLVGCTDCHGNDDDGGPRGPHGSRWDFLLRRRYDTDDPVAESASAYALCYLCHDRSSILADESFPLHRQHVVGESTPCSVCHAAHGVDAASATIDGASHLVNFDTRSVARNGDGQLAFRDRGRYSGSCSLSCHGHEHRDAGY